MVGIGDNVLKEGAEAELFLHAGDSTPKSQKNEQIPAARETVKTDEMRLNATGSSQKLWHQLHRKGLLRPIGGGRVVRRRPPGWGMLDEMVRGRQGCVGVYVVVGGIIGRCGVWR